jgi:hypothetical protein
VIIDQRRAKHQADGRREPSPSLFLLAKDLNRMQVWVAVNEADIRALSVRRQRSRPTRSRVKPSKAK